jgi:hypothetical protein
MTLDRVVIDMRAHMWEHGQLYVALSRVTDPKNLLVLLPDSADPDNQIIHYKVFKEISHLVLQIENQIQVQYDDYLKQKLSATDLNQTINLTLNPVFSDIPKILDQIQDVQSPPPPHPEEEEVNDPDLDEKLVDPSHVLHLLFKDVTLETNYFAAALYFCFAFKEIRDILADEEKTKKFDKIQPLHLLFDAWINAKEPDFDFIIKNFTLGHFPFKADQSVEEIIDTLIAAYNSLNCSIKLQTSFYEALASLKNWICKKTTENDTNCLSLSYAANYSSLQEILEKSLLLSHIEERTDHLMNKFSMDVEERTEIVQAEQYLLIKIQKPFDCKQMLLNINLSFKTMIDISKFAIVAALFARVVPEAPIHYVTAFRFGYKCYIYDDHVIRPIRIDDFQLLTVKSTNLFLIYALFESGELVWNDLHDSQNVSSAEDIIGSGNENLSDADDDIQLKSNDTKSDQIDNPTRSVQTTTIPVHLPPGLSNPFCACFFNATVQALISFNEVKFALEKKNFTHELLLQLMADLLKIPDSVLILNPIKTMESYQIDYHVQQDASEILFKILSIWDHSFQDLNICQITHQTYFLKDDGSVIGHVSVDQIRMMYVLTDDQNDQNLQNMVSQSCYATEILSHNVNASDINLTKIDRLIDFPVSLPIFVQLFRNINDQTEKIQKHVTFPLQLQVVNLLEQVHYYQLMAVIFHRGTLQKGHYVTIAKRNDQWFEFNDARVSVSSEEKLLNFGVKKADQFISFTPYGFMYQALESSQDSE